MPREEAPVQSVQRTWTIPVIVGDSYFPMGSRIADTIMDFLIQPPWRFAAFQVVGGQPGDGGWGKWA